MTAGPDTQAPAAPTPPADAAPAPEASAPAAAPAPTAPAAPVRARLHPQYAETLRLCQLANAQAQGAQQAARYAAAVAQLQGR